MAGLGMSRNMQNFDIIQPSLIQQMRTILDQYPDDGQILKELIQNAEDAKAKTIKFLFDKSTYPANTDQLVHPELVHFQGPALYAFNDATFGEEDWLGIRTIYDSFKKEDPIKVGRFGLGFKSVFHLTDLPGVLSGNMIGLLDPHERYFHDDRYRPLKGACWDLADIGDDQSGFYTPFTDPNLGLVFNKTFVSNNYYPGTLFRFPLRTTSNNSELCTGGYPVDKVEVLFEQFEQYSYMCLLFLSSLESIELYIRESRDHKPKIFFKVELAQKSKTAIRRKRQSFLAKIDKENWSNIPEYLSQEMIIHSQRSKKASHRWLVTNFFAGGDRLPRLKQLFQEKTLYYLPWVAVSMSLDLNLQPQRPQGHVFCFLPLPVEQKSQTGLPIHVNGFFAIDQNRRHLKWPNAEQLRSELTDRSLLWNRAMLEEAVPLAYTELIREGTRIKIPQNLIYQAIPCLGVVDSNWLQMVQTFLDYVTTIPFLYTIQGGGQHITLDQALFSFLSETKHPDTINAILLKAGRHVVCVPDHVKLALERFNKEVVTPEHLRRAVMDIQNTVETFPESESHCMEILAYAVADENYSGVVDLKLLPLASGLFTVFNKQYSERDKVYITTPDHPAELFPGLENRLACHMVDHRRRILEAIASSGKTNLVLMTREDALKMLSLVLHSPECMYVEWDLDNEKHITRGWIEKLWNYLNKMFFDDLCPVENLMLLPLRALNGKWYLKRLTKRSPVVYKNSEDNDLHASIFDFLKHVGVFVVDELSPFVKRHSMICEYVNSPSVSGILKCLSFLDRDKVVTKMTSLLPDMVLKFRKELAKADDCVLNDNREFLRSLPMFRVTTNTVHSVAERLYSINEIGTMSPVEDFSFKLPKPLIVPEDKFTERLCCVLEIQSLSLRDLLVDMIFPNISLYPHTEMDQLLAYVIRNHTALINRDTALQNCINGGDHFLCNSGVAAKLKSLYDPSSQKLQRLFRGQKVFLSGACASGDILPLLRELGLKTLKDVMPQDILQAAQLVASLPYDKGVEKANEIRKFLSTRVTTQIVANPLHRNLENIRWIPVKKRPVKYPTSLAWFGENSSFQTPYLLCDVSTSSLVGSVREVADMKLVDGMRHADITTEEVVANLSNVVDAAERSSPDECSLFLPIVEAINLFLQNQLKNESNQVSKFRMIFEGKKCIFIAGANKFVTPREISFLDDLSPLRYMVPSEMKLHFRQLLEAMGVAQKFDVEEYCNVLSEIKSNSNNQPLSEDMLNLSRTVANCIANSVKGKEFSRDVYLPDEANKTMQLSSTLCFNDCPWIPDSDMPFVDVNIPYPVAQVLGVKTKRRKTIEGSSFEIAFGQKESLINRIKRILDGYPGPIDILKEMLQNADDAQATEVHFCLDSRYHPTDRIFEDSWKPLQGPALCVYNNKPFTKEDVEGIQNLGEGNKGTDPTRTGQFGVGFCAVYHLTDTPSFLTKVTGEGERLYVFDPHCAYVPNATPLAPGKCFKDLNELRKTFPHVFECYDSIVTEDHMVDGTLFRFPLRSHKMAKKSKIKKTCTTVGDVRTMMRAFKEEAKSCLLFLNNVKKVSLYEIEDDISQVDTFTVTADHCKPHDVEELNRFKSYLNSVSRTGLRLLLRSQEVAYETTITDSEGSSKSWLIVQKCGFETNDHISERIRGAVSADELPLLPRGGVACELMDHEALKPYSIFCFLPLPQTTHLPVHINGHFALDHEARRRVWESADEDVKTEWNRLLTRLVIAHAYVRLVEEFKKRVVCSTDYGTTTLTQLRKYLNLFPKTRDTSEITTSIVREFYRILGDKELDALPVVLRNPNISDSCSVTWLPARDKGVNGAMFYSLPISTFSLQLSGEAENLSRKLASLFLKCGVNLLWEQCSTLADEFKASNVKILKLAPETIIDFFKNLSVDTETLLTVDEVIEILLYCKQIGQSFVNHLEGTQLLVVESGDMQVFSKDDPRYLSLNTFLVTEDYLDKFVHNELIRRVFSPPSQFLRSPMFKDVSLYCLSQMMPRELKGKSEIQSVEKWWQLMTRFWTFVGVKERNDPHMSLSPVADFCLIPAYRKTNDRILIQIKRAKTVVLRDPNKSFSHFGVQYCLESLDVPFLITDAKFSCNVLWSAVSSIDKPLDILQVAEQLRKSNAIQRKLTRDQRTRFLQHLCSIKEHLDKDRIRRLPLFCTKGGSVVSIANKRAVVLGSDIPSIDAHLWENNASVVFLDSTLSQSVIKYLGIETMDGSDLYVNYILPHFGNMSGNGTLEHLIFIKDVISRNLRRDYERREYFLSQLRNVPFIKSKDGVLCKASNFFDWKRNIFTEMLQEHYFPPEPFKSNEWHSFLVDLGLKHDVSSDQFVNFAKEIAMLDSKLQHKTKLRKSKLLTNYLAENYQKLGPAISRVKDIPFVAQTEMPESTLKMQARYSDENFGKFNGAVLGNVNVHLCWSSAVILESNSRMDESLALSLGVYLQPPPSLVIRHCSNLCSSFQKHKLTGHQQSWSTGLISRVMEEIYRFLENSALTVSEQEQLRSSAFVLVSDHKTFVLPRQVVEDITEEQQILPYLFKLPRDLDRYHRLFLKLGASRSLHVDLIGEVLYEIKKDAGGNSLDCGKEKKAHKALLALLSSTSTDIQTASFSRGLYLPTRDMKMVLANECVFIDDERIYEDVKNSLPYPVLAVPQSTNVDYKNKIAAINEHSRPLVLSDIMHMKVETDGKLVSQDQSKNAFVKHIYARLTSGLFHRAVARLMYHVNSKKRLPVTRVLKTMQQKFSKVEVFEAEKVRAFYVDAARGKKVCENKNCTGVSFDRGKGCPLKVYIQSDGQKSEVYNSLVTVIAHYSGVDFGMHVLQLLELLKLENSHSDFDFLLDKYEIQRLPAMEDSLHPSKVI